MTHKQIMKFFDIVPATAYRWFPPRRGGETADADILRRINDGRRNGQPFLRSLPKRLYRANTLEAWTAKHTARPRSAETIREWATKHGAPHIRLNRSIFFDLPTLMLWLDGQRNPLRRSTLDTPKGD